MPIREKIRKEPCEIIQKLTDNGYEAYIVGGAVRDLLLGFAPKDYDIATSASPEQVRAVFGRRYCRIIGRRFRLAHVICRREIYEVSTFRRSPTAQERCGRPSDDGEMIWRDNAYGTLEEDAARRDFSVNAMYYDVVGDRQVIDFCGGQKDLKKQVVRSLGDPLERFTEDPVRMIRAMKLCGLYDFKLARDVTKAIREKKEILPLASSLRLFEELLKILSCRRPASVLRQLRQHGLLQYLWPIFDNSWEDPEGELALQMLDKLETETMANSDGQYSKTFALAVCCLPFLMSALNPNNMLDFWRDDHRNNLLATRAMRLIFDKYTLPRFIAERLQQVIFLVPHLLTTPIPAAALTHPEYRHARHLILFLSQIHAWGDRYLQYLPETPPLSRGGDRDRIERKALPQGQNADAEPGAQPATTRRRPRRRKRPNVAETAVETAVETAAETAAETIKAAPLPKVD